MTPGSCTLPSSLRRGRHQRLEASGHIQRCDGPSVSHRRRSGLSHRPQVSAGPESDREPEGGSLQPLCRPSPEAPPAASCKAESSVSLEGGGSSRGVWTQGLSVFTHTGRLCTRVGGGAHGEGAHGGGVPAWGLQPETAGLPAMASSTGAGWSWVPAHLHTPTPRPAGISCRPLTSVSVQTQACGSCSAAPAAPPSSTDTPSPNPSVSTPALHRRALPSMVSRPWPPSWRQVHHSGHMPSLTSAPRAGSLGARDTDSASERARTALQGRSSSGCCPQHRWGSHCAQSARGHQVGVVRNAWGE